MSRLKWVTVSSKLTLAHFLVDAHVFLPNEILKGVEIWDLAGALPRLEILQAFQMSTKLCPAEWPSRRFNVIFWPGERMKLEEGLTRTSREVEVVSISTLGTDDSIPMATDHSIAFSAWAAGAASKVGDLVTKIMRHVYVV